MTKNSYIYITWKYFLVCFDDAPAITLSTKLVALRY